MQPRCYTSLATRNHCYNETRTRLTVCSGPLLTASSLLGWFLALHCLLSALIACFFTAWLILGSLLLIWSASSVLVCLCLKCSPPWNRFLAYRVGDTLSKGKCSSVIQVVTGIAFDNIRCSDNNCLPSRCLGVPSHWLAVDAVVQEITFRSDSTVPSFRQHATLCVRMRERERERE
jgi:hypothetical protein